VRPAVAIWRQWPTEIESDLLPKADIHDWHRGTRDEYGVLKLSSRRLLVLLEFLPEESAFKTAAERDGGWTLHQLIASETHNELARLRASYHAVHGGEEAVYEPHEFLDPSIDRLREKAAQSEDQEFEEATHELHAELGFS
jgi:hypothetical protein